MTKRKNHHSDELIEPPPPVDEPVVDKLETPETQVVPPPPMGVGVLRCQKQRHRDHVAAGGISIYG